MDIAAHLVRHGLTVAVRNIVAGDIKTADIPLNEAAHGGAGLIVMNGYGHSGLREFVLRWTTRSLLAQMTVPILMSH